MPFAPPHRRITFGSWLSQFWRRVTTGLELNQLWAQFRADARTSYDLYSREAERARPKEADGKQKHHFFDKAKQYFWAVLEQLSPARRVILLLALFLVMATGVFTWRDHAGYEHVVDFDFRVLGALLLLLLLLLEVTDRVVMKRDLQIAREIQTWLLPSRPPDVPGLDIAFAARPANTVAGDYYDVFPRASFVSQTAEHQSPASGHSAPETSPAFLFAVADVAGKSIPAALLMASVQASLKTLSTTPCSLAELADGMNRYVYSNSQGGRRFVTAFLAEYSPADRTLTYINAGHNPPLLRRAAGNKDVGNKDFENKGFENKDQGNIERLEAGGLPLGIEPAAAYQTGRVTLGPGDWLAIFTDGLVEATNERHEEYGEQRVIACLQSGAADSSISASTLISQIMVGLDVFVGKNLPLADDVTCVLVKAVST